MPDIENPFTEEDFDQIVVSLERGQETINAINKAVRAGLPVAEMLDGVRDQVQRLQRIKQTYWPDR